MKKGEKMKTNWKHIKDTQVKSIWKCSSCGATTNVHPHEYATSGIPTCISGQACEGTEMDYVKTIVVI